MRKRSTRKYKRRSSRRNAPLVNQLRSFSHKCTGVFPVVIPTDGSLLKTYVFSRYDYQGIVQNVYGINSPPRFDQVKKNYEQYKVTGFKLKFLPTSIHGAYDANG